MRVLTRLIEDPFDIPIERPEYANTRHHRWSIPLGDKDEAFDRRLPFFEIFVRPSAAS
jgi:hypothetical protein